MKVPVMACSDINESVLVPTKPQDTSLMPVEERLNALSPSERKHILESVEYHKSMLVELSKM